MKKMLGKTEISEKIWFSAKNLIIKGQIGKTKLGGCLKFWHEKIWVGIKNLGEKNPKNGKNLVVRVISV